jgi:hypothetical protein
MKEQDSALVKEFSLICDRIVIATIAMRKMDAQAIKNEDVDWGRYIQVVDELTTAEVDLDNCIDKMPEYLQADVRDQAEILDHMAIAMLMAKSEFPEREAYNPYQVWLCSLLVGLIHR